jgi:hypothetical protein
MAGMYNKYLMISMNKRKVKAVVRPDLHFLFQMHDQRFAFSFLKYVLCDYHFPEYLILKTERYFFCFNHFMNYSG